MRRVFVFGVVALLLAGSVFAPTAAAQEPGDITIDEVTLGPGGSVIVSGTVECVEGTFIGSGFFIRQRTSGNLFNEARTSIQVQCTSTGPTSFTTQAAFGDRPFHPGPASVQVQPFSGDTFTEAVRITS